MAGELKRPAEVPAAHLLGRAVIRETLRGWVRLAGLDKEGQKIGTFYQNLHYFSAVAELAEGRLGGWDGELVC